MKRRVRVKPSKAQSMVGLFVGIVFCFIGLFFVVPSFGPFGLFWTAIAVIITVMNGYNAFSDKGIASSEIMIDDDYDNEQTNYNGGKTVEERLQELHGLYERGLITTEEYQNSRKKILEEI